MPPCPPFGGESVGHAEGWRLLFRYARMVCRMLLRLRAGESRRSLVVAAMYVRFISQVKSKSPRRAHMAEACLCIVPVYGTAGPVTRGEAGDSGPDPFPTYSTVW